MSPPPDIAAAFAAAGARCAPFPLELRWHAAVTSTMDVAARAVETGAPEGLVVAADEQSAGRGRRGRTWSSPAGAGLYVSVVFRPRLDRETPPALSLITLAAGVAVRSAIARVSGLEAELKWPNDVMVGRRKLAGVLAEGVAFGTGRPAVVLGIGVNVRIAMHPRDVGGRATSLESELGRPVDRALLLEELLVSLVRVYADLNSGRADDILRRWREAAPTAEGAEVEWDAGDGRRRGRTAGLDPGGALMVQTTEGIDRVIAGEVRWL